MKPDPRLRVGNFVNPPSLGKFNDTRDEQSCRIFYIGGQSWAIEFNFRRLEKKTFAINHGTDEKKKKKSQQWPVITRCRGHYIQMSPRRRRQGYKDTIAIRRIRERESFSSRRVFTLNSSPLIPRASSRRY